WRHTRALPGATGGGWVRGVGLLPPHALIRMTPGWPKSLRTTAEVRSMILSERQALPLPAALTVMLLETLTQARVRSTAPLASMTRSPSLPLRRSLETQEGPGPARTLPRVETSRSDSRVPIVAIPDPSPAAA